MLSKEENRQLIADYPFLDPRKSNPSLEDKYDFSYTMMEPEMPEGWRKAFGRQLCQEIKEELDRCGCADDYIVLQIKEKFAELCWYDAGVPEECHVNKIIDKYTELSRKTCVVCGQPAAKISLGWYCPYCDDCADTMTHTQFVSWEEFYAPRKEGVQ